MSPGGYSEFQGTGLIEEFFGFRHFFLRRGAGWGGDEENLARISVCLDLSKNIFFAGGGGGENNLNACERSKTKLDL